MPLAPLSAPDKADLHVRLRRVEGQLRGLQRLVAEDRDCLEIAQQLTAARAALDRVGHLLIASGVRGGLGETTLTRSDQKRLETTLAALAALRA